MFENVRSFLLSWLVVMCILAEFSNAAAMALGFDQFAPSPILAWLSATFGLTALWWWLDA